MSATIIVLPVVRIDESAALRLARAAAARAAHPGAGPVLVWCSDEPKKPRVRRPFDPGKRMTWPDMVFGDLPWVRP
jgi:hypothetical protein